MTASDRSRIRRLPEKGVYDRDIIDAILDEALYCHVGFLHDGAPMVIPTIHARHEDTLYLHGSPASRLLRTIGEGAVVCVTATLLDGLVVARSLYHSSMQYRSVVVFGAARRVVAPEEKWLALRAITDHVLPGRWDDARLPSEAEFAATAIVAVAVEEASAKVSAGPPEDEEADYTLPYWAGVVPLSLVAGTPQADPQLAPGIPPPSYLPAAR